MAQETGSQYIARCRKMGFSDQEITEAMQKVGWQSADLQSAFAAANQMQTGGAKASAKKKSPLLWIILAVVLVVFLLLGGLAAYMYFFTDTFTQQPEATDFTYKVFSTIIG